MRQVWPCGSSAFWARESLPRSVGLDRLLSRRRMPRARCPTILLGQLLSSGDYFAWRRLPRVLQVSDENCLEKAPLELCSFMDVASVCPEKAAFKRPH